MGSHTQKNQIDPYLTQGTNVNSKQIKDLNVRPETMKFLGENIRDKLLDIDLGSDFLDLKKKNPKAKATKAKITSETTSN